MTTIAHEQTSAFSSNVKEKLAGKRVLVTGGTSGIGYELVKQSRKAGADVIFTWNTSEAEAKEIPQGMMMKKCCYKYEDYAGGKLASYTSTILGVGEGNIPDCKTVNCRWNGLIGISHVDLGVTMDGDDLSKAKGYLDMMIAKAKKMDLTKF